MSPRYYFISAVIVIASTIVISLWKQKKTGKEVFFVFGQVVMLWCFLLGVVFGLAEILVYLGIAQSGFMIQGEELK